MISRVAESCFWLFRNVERVESTARLLTVNRSFVLDLGLSEAEHWEPLVIVSGEQKRFEQLHSARSRDGEIVQNYFVWNEDNPVSIVSSARWARENARVIREAISSEVWEALNSFWHWLSGGQGRRDFRANRDRFYIRVIETCHLFHGLSHNTMLHDETFDFMRLGMLLERAGQTARALDIKHHAFGSSGDAIRSPEEAAQWSAILQSCGATEVFLKRFGGVIDAPSVVEFLFLEPLFPRSILHCVDRAWNFLHRIRPRGQRAIGQESARLLSGLGDQLKKKNAADVLTNGLHRELTSLIDAITTICSTLHKDYFDPPLAQMRRRTNSRPTRGETA